MKRSLNNNNCACTMHAVDNANVFLMVSVNFFNARSSRKSFDWVWTSSDASEWHEVRRCLICRISVYVTDAAVLC
jgi:general stress protein 26